MHIDTAITYENIQPILEIATNKTPSFTLRLCSCPALCPQSHRVEHLFNHKTDRK